MKLGDIVTIKVGRNLSRGNKIHNQSLDAYSYEDLMDDLDGLFFDSKASTNESSGNIDSHLSRAGEVVFSFVSSKAAVISDLNKGKVINQNFAKLIIKHEEQLDSSYLCFVLNESRPMKKQMAISMQGSTVPKLTPSILKALDVDLPNMEKQQTIGKAYLSLKKHHALAMKQAKLEEQLYLEVLKQIDQ